MAPIHVWGRLFETDRALLLFVFVLAAFIAESIILGQGIITISQVYTIFDIFFVVKFFGATIFALETMFTLPRLRNMVYLGFEAERVVGPITNIAKR